MAVLAPDVYVDGLASLYSIGGGLAIEVNSALCESSAVREQRCARAALCESSIDALLSRLAGFGYAGATVINGDQREQLRLLIPGGRLMWLREALLTILSQNRMLQHLRLSDTLIYSVSIVPTR